MKRLLMLVLLCGCDGRNDAERYAERHRAVAAEAIGVCLTLCGDAGVRKMEIKSFDCQPICECR